MFMPYGLIFDIKEFSIHDGPGIRTTVFMKGCPLACMWCHNPEGQSMHPQTMHTAAGQRVAGRHYQPAELAERLNRQAPILRANEGGITFSGGEPLLQAAFISEVINLLDDLHVLLDTSGCGDARDFSILLNHIDLVFFDLKLMDTGMHQRYTGTGNETILKNLDILNASNVPFHIRVPLVPGVTDSEDNLRAIAEHVRDYPALQQVDLLPYNRAAGAKYRSIGRTYLPDFDEQRPVNPHLDVFDKIGVKVILN